MEIHFEFKVKPEPWARVMRGKFGAFVPPKTRRAKQEIAFLAKSQLPSGFEMLAPKHPIEVRIIFNLLKPKSTPKNVNHPAVRPDLDNYVKLIFDALNGILWNDDAQIWRLIAEKRYTENESTHMTIIY